MRLRASHAWRTQLRLDILRGWRRGMLTPLDVLTALGVHPFAVHVVK